METIKRDRCVLTDTDDLAEVYTFKDSPVFCGCVDSESEDVLWDMSWSVSESSGIIR